MIFETFLHELGRVLQLSLASDQNGACLIIMKEKEIPLLFELDEQLVPNKILISSKLFSFPIERCADIYGACLKINHTIEETLSVKPDEDILYLHRRINPEIQAEDLKGVVFGFVKQIGDLTQQIEALLKEPSKYPQVPSSPSIQIFPYKA